MDAQKTKSLVVVEEGSQGDDEDDEDDEEGKEKGGVKEGQNEI